MDMLAVNQGLDRRRFWPSFQDNFESKEWVSGLGSRDSWLKIQKHALIVTSPPENASMSTRRLAESVGFEQLSSSSSWRFMAKKGPANRGR